MNIQTLLMIDIGVIITIPATIIFSSSIIGIIAVCILTSILVYLDTLTFKSIENTENTCKQITNPL